MEIIRKTLEEIIQTCDTTVPVNPLMGTIKVDFSRVEHFTWIRRNDGSIESLTISFIGGSGG